MFPGMAPRAAIPNEERVGLPIPVEYFTLIAVKVVRGLFFVEEQRFIEPPYTIDHYVYDEEEARRSKRLLAKFGAIYAREPGLIVHRAVAVDDRAQFTIQDHVLEAVDHVRDRHARMRRRTEL